MKESRGLKVLMLGAFDPDYPRHAILKTGLEALGVQVTLANLPKSASTLQRMRLALRWWARFRDYDALLIPAFNQTLAPFVWLLSRVTATRVLLDYMVGLSDVNADRGTESGLKQILFRLVDQFNITVINSFTDTAAHRDWFRRHLGVRVGRMRVVPVGVKPAWLDAPPPPTIQPVTAAFIGSYIPFQGVEVILQAAQRLRDESRIRFLLIGSGQTYPQARQLADSLDLHNVDFRAGFFPLPQLMPLVADCAILLGVFGAAEKTAYVIPNKVFDGVASGRAVITAESPALSECFTPGEHLLTVPPGDAQALADALTALLDHPERIAALGAAGQQRIRDAFLPDQVARPIVDWLAGRA